MNIDLYQIDAFASKVFEGNPAAVCPLNSWIDNAMMQQIAMENNLSETAFFVKEGSQFNLRWFTPEAEVDLCGHATLAAAHVLFEHLGYDSDTITFETRSGELRVQQKGELLVMDFPTASMEKTDLPQEITKALGVRPLECYQGMDYLLLLENEQQVRELAPNFLALKKMDTRGIMVTAPGDEEDVDFISRFFAPGVGINEDPVTGSAHTALTPYWVKKLARTKLKARQISKRGGEVECKLIGDRVELGGRAQTFLTGIIEFSDS